MYAKVKYYNSIEKFKEFEHDEKKKYLICLTQNDESYIEQLRVSNLDYVGAIFPSIIYNNKICENGFMLFELKDGVNLCFIEDMNNYLIEQDIFENIKSIVTIIDGFSKHSSSFLENIFEDVDLDTNIIGGGAGIFPESNRKVLFDKAGRYNDAALLLLLTEQIEMGIGLGWEHMDGPFIVTSVENNILKQIDYKNAFEYYRDIIKKNTGKTITKDNYYDIVKDYPLGVIKLNDKFLVRDPASFNDDGSLIMVSDIQPNSVINVLKGRKESLIKDTSRAALEASKNQTEVLMMFECVSRLDYLGEDFQNELDTIVKETSTNQIFGVISIGEIANDGNKYISILNKSSVMGGLCL